MGTGANTQHLESEVTPRLLGALKNHPILGISHHQLCADTQHYVCA